VRYSVHWTDAAQKQLKRLPAEVRERMLRAAVRLRDDPRPAGTKKLAARSNEWRLRFGDYRMVYTIEDNVLRVEVIRATHRADAYEG
jgi:mRNA interferase RelE/StbE